MTYAIFSLGRTQREVANIPSEAYERVRNAIRALDQDPRPPGSRKLAGRDGWRPGVGNYRMIYDIDDT